MPSTPAIPGQIDQATHAGILYDRATGVLGPRREIVLLNATAALVAAKNVEDLREGCCGPLRRLIRGGCGDVAEVADVWERWGRRIGKRKPTCRY